MATDTIRAVLTSDGLVCKILSFLVPVDADTARELAVNTMPFVSAQFEQCFLQCLRSGTPLALRYSSRDGDNQDAEGTMIWAKHRDLKIGRIEAFINRFDIEQFVGALTGLDVSSMVTLDLNIEQRNHGYRAEELQTLYTLLAQPSLKDLTIFDQSSCEAYQRFFTLENLKRVHVRHCRNMEAALNDILKLPNLEYLKTGEGLRMPLEINSPSLNVLDISDNFDSVIGELCCPSLTRLICEDDCVVFGVPIDALLGLATTNDEFGILEKDREATQVRTLQAEEVVQSQDFQVGVGCQFVVVTY